MTALASQRWSGTSCHRQYRLRGTSVGGALRLESSRASAFRVLLAPTHTSNDHRCDPLGPLTRNNAIRLVIRRSRQRRFRAGDFFVRGVDAGLDSPTTTEIDQKSALTWTYVVGVRGFEPPASASRTLRANQTALHPVDEASELYCAPPTDSRFVTPRSQSQNGRVSGTKSTLGSSQLA